MTEFWLGTPLFLFFPLVLGVRMDAGEMSAGGAGEMSAGGDGMVGVYAFAAQLVFMK